MVETPNGTRRRTYKETHPWISFSLDLKKVDYRLWMDLGAIQSKIEHVANVLLPPNVARDLRTLYLAKGVHGTTAIEGNSLTEEQVRNRIAHQTPLPDSKAYLGREIDNIVAACNGILKGVLHGEGIELTPERIKAFNKMALEGLPLPDHVEPGRTRKCAVGVGHYKAPRWEDCPYLLERLCQFLNCDLRQPTEAVSTGFGVLLAIVAHLYIAWIHPFGDGNGRTARLIEFQILLSKGVPDIAAHLLSNFYNQTREKYYRELSAASQSGGDVSGFLQYAVQGFRDQLDEQIQHIRTFQWDVVWRDFVYETFREQSGQATHRRRTLALELPQACSVEISKLTQLTPEIAVLYASRTKKTLTRDLNDLEKLQLIVCDGNKVRANAAILAQFLPSRRASSGVRWNEETSQASES